MAAESMADAEDNSLLDFSGRVRFDAVRAGHVEPAIDHLLADCRAAVEMACDAGIAADWETVVAPIDAAANRLSRAWSAAKHLNDVLDTPALRAAYNAVLPKLTAFWTELAQNLALFDQFKRMSLRDDFAQWPAARRKVIENELRDFRLGGAELPADDKARLRQIHERAALLATRFAENVLDATNRYALHVDEPKRLSGIPEDVLQAYREAAAAEGRGGFRITLHFPSYQPAVQYADDRALREELYRAYFSRASEFGPAELDNGPPMVELLRLRREEACLLGFADYAALSLATKMAESPQEVIGFLRDLARRARPHAERDMAELSEFAAADLGLANLQVWDHAYVGEKLRQARYAYSEQELKQYFPEPRVLTGIFRLFETLFAVRILADAAPTWHPDVHFYRIESADGATLGSFYLDLYARDHKQGGAWHAAERSRYRSAEGLQTPVSFLTCNFSRPIDGRPARFTHREVLTLLHEFGHGLHHLLTRVDEPSVSGIHGVEWDAVELPSQFMENFGWDWNVLQWLSGHVDSGQPLPRALFDRMIAARNFQSGMQTLRQIEFGLFDMRMHTEIEPDHATPQQLLDLLLDVRREVAVVHPPVSGRMPWSFTHIFAGSYAAGYYSYKWAEVLSADAFAAFEEAGNPDSTLNTALGHRFRDEVLAVGGTRPAMESFIAFRGRKPSLDALLRHHGITA